MLEMPHKSHLKSIAIGVGCGALLFIGLGIWRTTSESAMSLRANCSKGQPAHTALAQSKNAVLRKLAEYETVCKGAVVDKMMVFVAMPNTQADAVSFAKETSRQLMQFSRQGIEPLVVFEPSITVPDILPSIAGGAYDSVLDTYFSEIKAAGITTGSMGTWVLLPEANTPIWHITNPTVFVRGVNTIATHLKQVFPKNTVTIMLNSTTYPDNDMDWAHGETKSLRAYGEGIKPGLVDSVGLQGFPHVSSPQDAIPTPKEFLSSNLATDLADVLHVRTVWFNTGTYKRTNMGGMPVEATLTTDQREKLLGGVLEQAINSRNRSYSTSVNIFAENKSDVHEHTDWSYWQPGKMDQSKDTAILDQFIRRVRQNGLGFSLYDH